MLRFIKFIGFLSDDKTFIIRSYLHGTIKLWSIFMQIIDTYYYL